MKFDVKLVGTLGKFLPSGSSNNVTQVETDASITISELIERVGLPPDNPYIVSVNDTLVPTKDRQNHQLSDSDNVKIIPPLKGG